MFFPGGRDLLWLWLCTPSDRDLLWLCTRECDRPLSGGTMASVLPTE